MKKLIVVILLLISLNGYSINYIRIVNDTEISFHDNTIELYQGEIFLANDINNQEVTFSFFDKQISIPLNKVELINLSFPRIRRYNKFLQHNFITEKEKHLQLNIKNIETKKRIFFIPLQRDKWDRKGFPLKTYKEYKTEKEYFKPDPKYIRVLIPGYPGIFYKNYTNISEAVNIPNETSFIWANQKLTIQFNDNKASIHQGEILPVNKETSSEYRVNFHDNNYDLSKEYFTKINLSDYYKEIWNKYKESSTLIQKQIQNNTFYYRFNFSSMGYRPNDIYVSNLNSKKLRFASKNKEKYAVSKMGEHIRILQTHLPTLFFNFDEIKPLNFIKLANKELYMNTKDSIIYQIDSTNKLKLNTFANEKLMLNGKKYRTNQDGYLTPIEPATSYKWLYWILALVIIVGIIVLFLLKRDLISEKLKQLKTNLASSTKKDKSKPASKPSKSKANIEDLIHHIINKRFKEIESRLNQLESEHHELIQNFRELAGRVDEVEKTIDDFNEQVKNINQKIKNEIESNILPISKAQKSKERYPTKEELIHEIKENIPILQSQEKLQEYVLSTLLKSDGLNNWLKEEGQKKIKHNLQKLLKNNTEDELNKSLTEILGPTNSQEQEDIKKFSKILWHLLNSESFNYQTDPATYAQPIDETADNIDQTLKGKDPRINKNQTYIEVWKLIEQQKQTDKSEVTHKGISLKEKSYNWEEFVRTHNELILFLQNTEQEIFNTLEDLLKHEKTTDWDEALLSYLMQKYKNALKNMKRNKWLRVLYVIQQYKGYIEDERISNAIYHRTEPNDINAYLNKTIYNELYKNWLSGVLIIMEELRNLFMLTKIQLPLSYNKSIIEERIDQILTVFNKKLQYDIRFVPLFNSINDSNYAPKVNAKDEKLNAVIEKKMNNIDIEAGKIIELLRIGIKNKHNYNKPEEHKTQVIIKRENGVYGNR